MINIELTKQQRDNLLALLTGPNRISISGEEAFEFVSIVNAISSGKEFTKGPHQE